jgi:hypothetical protein
MTKHVHSSFTFHPHDHWWGERERDRENWSLLFGLVSEGGRNTNHLSIRSFIERERERKSEREGMIKVKA